MPLNISSSTCLRCRKPILKFSIYAFRSSQLKMACEKDKGGVIQVGRCHYQEIVSSYSLFKRELHQEPCFSQSAIRFAYTIQEIAKVVRPVSVPVFCRRPSFAAAKLVRLILNDWRDLQERDVEIPLYQRFKSISNT